jgi:uncharacterized SAM-binding protein YcdF (DUF218 family)
MRRLIKLLLAVAVLAGIVWLMGRVGPWLIIDQPQRSDVLIILGGDENDVRLHQGEQLLRQGYAGHGFIDAVISIVNFGRTPAENAEEYLSRAPQDVRTRMSVCPMTADSTKEEITAVRVCLDKVGARRVLIVTSDYHTRRSLSVARKILPQYQWSASAARTQVSQPKWWRRRGTVRDVFIEYEKLVFWKLVESHL